MCMVYEMLGTAILLFSIVTVASMGKDLFAIPLGLYIAI